MTDDDTTTTENRPVQRPAQQQEVQRDTQRDPRNDERGAERSSAGDPRQGRPDRPAPTDADDEFATVDETTVDRDTSGHIAPEVVEVPELAPDDETRKVKARPMNNAARRRYLEPLSEGEDLDDATLAQMFDDHIVRPDLSQHPACEGGTVTEEFVTYELEPRAEDGYFFSILLASGEAEIVEQFRAVRRGDVDESDLVAAGEGNGDEGPTVTGQHP